MKSRSDPPSLRHAFVLVAYGESPYLRECAESLRNQRGGGAASSGENGGFALILATSTPSETLEDTAKEYGMTYRVNPERGGGIAADWNFALECAGDAEYVTLAHQDDLYFPAYREAVLSAAASAPDALLLFTDYAELRNGGFVKWNTLLAIKRLLLAPYFLRRVWRSGFLRRRFLSLGSTICCPAVTLRRAALPDFRFDRDYKVDLDWDAWVRLTERPGAFVFVRRVLMAHRIHGGSETTNCIADNRRSREDMMMFQRLWPGWIAKIIAGFYRKSESCNS